MQMPSNKIIDFLVVGQNEDLLTRDAELLKKAGYKNVLHVDSGVKARGALRNLKVKFVISELNMPHMSGIELLKLVRRNPSLSETPFLLVSDIKNKEVVLYALDEMSDGYLAMPYSGEDFLCSVIRIQLKKRNLTAAQKEIISSRRLFLQRKYEKAIQSSKEFLNKYKDNLDAQLILSESFYRIRDIEKAKKVLNEILKTNPTNSRAMHILSKVCRLDADCGVAFSYLTAANKQNPLNKELKVDLGKFYLETDMEEKAQEIFNEMLNEDITDLNLVKIGKAFLKRNRLSEAGKYLNKTVDPLPETAYIFAQFADQLAAAGEQEKSIEQYRRCLRLIPANAEYVVKLAGLLNESDKKQEAKDSLQKFLEICPEQPDVLNLLNSL